MSIKRTTKYSWKRALLAGGLVAAYLTVWTLYGSPLLALTTWLGWVEPQP